MKANKFVSTVILWPLSKVYGAVIAMRNRLFDWGLLKQREFDVPVIVVGNIAVGGTGKTPHTEYIVDLLRYNYRIGVLSRGYKRSTKGFVLATRRSTPSDIGDEPYQIYQKYSKDVVVAVCENRCDGIEKLLEIDSGINLILGRLRESPRALNRADIVVVTKCPDTAKPMDLRIINKNLNLFPFQQLFFSRYNYGNLVSVFPDDVTYIPYLEWLTEADSILVVTGVANPRPFIRHLKHYNCRVRVKHFPDHHNFTRKDLQLIEEKFESMPGERKYIVTTEKDAVRIANNPYFPHHLKALTFYLPIKVEFLPQAGISFDDELRQLIAQGNRSR